jgi:hypothetical protein
MEKFDIFDIFGDPRKNRPMNAYEKSWDEIDDQLFSYLFFFIYPFKIEVFQRT